MPRVEIVTELDSITCYRTDCGILFAVPDLWLANKRRDHSDFTCPNGHSQAFLTKSKEEQLRDELAKTRQSVEYYRQSNQRLEDRAKTLKHQVRAQKGVATRLRNKAIAGICAACHENFPDVARHMASEHADWVPEELDEGEAP